MNSEAGTLKQEKIGPPQQSEGGPYSLPYPKALNSTRFIARAERFAAGLYLTVSTGHGAFTLIGLA